MAKDHGLDGSPLAEDFDVGDDSDLPGFDQPYTFDDVEAIRNAADMSVEQRRSELRVMLDDLRARQRIEETNEFGGLFDEIRGALVSLKGPAEDAGGIEEIGFDGEEAVLAPDEVLERAEEHAQLEREETTAPH